MTPKRAEIKIEDLKSRFASLFPGEDDSTQTDQTPHEQQESSSISEDHVSEARLPEPSPKELVDDPVLPVEEPPKKDPHDEEIAHLIAENEQLKAKIQELLAQIDQLKRSANSEPPIEIDMLQFVNDLKTLSPTRPKGTSHSVSEVVDDWLSEIRHQLEPFGRSKGPNEAQLLWNMGMMLLKSGLEAHPNWTEEIKKLIRSPDMALVEVYRMAIQGLRKSTGYKSK